VTSKECITNVDYRVPERIKTTSSLPSAPPVTQSRAQTKLGYSVRRLRFAFPLFLSIQNPLQSVRANTRPSPSPLHNQPNMREARLEETLGLAHGGLDVERTDVLPLLLEQRDQEVDGQHDVLDDLVLLHVDVGDGDTKTKNLLKLELDGGSDLIDLSGKVFVVGDRGREFTGLGKTGTQETANERCPKKAHKVLTEESA